MEEVQHVALALLLALGALAASSARGPVAEEVPANPDVEYITSTKNISFQVYVVTFLPNGSAEFCSGAILDTHHVLTVSTCVAKGYSATIPKVQVIVQHGEPLEPNHMVFDVVSETFYYKKKTERADGDIAILQVDRPMLSEKDTIQVVPLQTQRRYRSKNCTLSGWTSQQKPRYKGEHGFRLYPPVRFWDLESVPWRRCFSQIYHKPSDDLLCIGKRKRMRDTCQEDPGTPVVCDGLLTGLVSGARGCSRLNFAYLYTDLGYYWPWINATLQQHAQREALDLGEWEPYQRMSSYRRDEPPPKRRRRDRQYFVFK